MDWKKNMFAKEVVNGGRQDELDLAKAVIIVCLALIHCTIECTPEEGLASGIPYLFDSVIGVPLAAPMFMFAMGIGMVYTRHDSPADHMRRGIRLGVISYVFNICRFLIPFLVGYALTGSYARFLDPLPYRVLGNDILQFACLAMLLMGVLLYLHVPDLCLFLIALGMSLAGMYLNGVDVGSPYGNIFLGYLIGTEDAAGKVFSDFPLLNWFIVPVSGYLFGKYLRHVKNKRLFYGVFSSVCGILAVLWFGTGIYLERGMFGEGQNCYYHIVTPDVLAAIAGAVGILGFYYVIVRFIPARAMAVIREISRNINSIYCIHWMFVSSIAMVGLYVVRGTSELPVPVTMVLGISIIVVSIVIAHFWSTSWKARIVGGSHEK